MKVMTRDVARVVATDVMKGRDHRSVQRRDDGCDGCDKRHARRVATRRKIRRDQRRDERCDKRCDKDRDASERLPETERQI